MHLKYFACWELMTFTPNDSFSFCRNTHMYFKKSDIIQRHCGECVRTSLVILTEASISRK